MKTEKFKPTAFPLHPDAVNGGEHGLTKREYFALGIIQGLVAKHGNYTNITYTAVHIADMLILELEK